MLQNVTSEPLTEEQRELILRANVIQLNTDTTRMKTTLYDGIGNELPLVERVRNLEKYIEGQKFWLRTIAVALVVQIVGAAVTAIYFWVQLYPVLSRIANQP